MVTCEMGLFEHWNSSIAMVSVLHK